MIMKKKYIRLVTVVIIIASLFFWVLQSFNSSDESQHHISGAYEALNLWSMQRAYPNKNLPDGAYYAAYQHVQEKMISKKSLSPSVDPWESIGPVNLGGRTLVVEFNPQNPNTIYAGSASGGLWRSFSGGRGADAWEYVPTGFPVLGVSSIVFVPDDSNTFYIGTGEVYNYQNAGTDPAYRNTRGSYGIGILKTTDGGQTWSKSLDWSYNQQHGVWAVEVNPLNPNTVWAATTDGTYKSTDAGANWNQVHNVIMGMDLVINPMDTNMVFASYGNFQSNGFGIYRTTDGGANWTKLTQGLPTIYAGKAFMDIVPSQPNPILFASIGNGFGDGNPPNASWLCKSTNHGDSWTIESRRDYSKWQGWYSHDVAVNPSDSNEVIAVGIEIYKSTTGGSNLAQKSTTDWFIGRIPPEGPEGPPTYSHADHHDVIYHPTDHNIIYFGNDGGVFRSTDGGETFESCNGGYQTSQFYGGFSSAETDSQLSMGGFQDNSTAVYDGQPIWRVHLGGGDGGWTAIHPTDPQIMYASAQFLQLAKSTNGLQSFVILSVPNVSGGPTVFIAPYVLAKDNPNILYAGRELIYKSTDGGFNWSTRGINTFLDGNPFLAMAISPQNSDVVYAATAPLAADPGVFRTTDGGVSWDSINGNLPNRFPGDLRVDPNNEATVYITMMGFGSSHVFKSNDYGSTWQDIDNGGLPDVPTSAVVIDREDPDHIYIGNDLGVFISDDGGITWEPFSDGLPQAVLVLDLSISPLNRKLRVATHGNGAYERDLLEPSVGISRHGPQITEFRLDQNYPNPFNPTTKIRFGLPQATKVRLEVCNLIGQRVAVLVDEQKPAGFHEVNFDGRDMASGMYFYRIQTAEFTATKKMLMMK